MTTNKYGRKHAEAADDAVRERAAEREAFCRHVDDLAARLIANEHWNLDDLDSVASQVARAAYAITQAVRKVVP